MDPQRQQSSGRSLPSQLHNTEREKSQLTAVGRSASWQQVALHIAATMAMRDNMTGVLRATVAR
eukprot:98263-Pelagomonas_calceolata.AAC.1